MSFSSRHILVLLLLPLGTVACKDKNPEQAALRSTQGSANQERVVEMLHQQKLITIPEVKEKSDYYMEQYRSNQMSREEAAQKLRLWMEEWVKENPEKARVAAAGNSPAAPPSPPTPQQP